MLEDLILVDPRQQTSNTKQGRDGQRVNNARGTEVQVAGVNRLKDMPVFIRGMLDVDVWELMWIWD